MIEVSFLGIGACRMKCGGTTLYIDAFNEICEPPTPSRGDVLLFTHDDGDHFCVESLRKRNLEGVAIIGPYAVAYRCLESGAAAPGLVRAAYPNDRGEPIDMSLGEIGLRIYNTEHFVEWSAAHVSYRIAFMGKRLYVTGDSAVGERRLDDLRDLDCLVASPMQVDVMKGRVSKEYEKYFALCDLIRTKEMTGAKLVLANHLIGCGWAVDPLELRGLIEAGGIRGIAAPIDEEEVFAI